MQYSLALVALAAHAFASPLPQSGETSSECSPSYDGEFTITTANVTSSSAKRWLSRRQAQTLELTLSDGVLMDSEDRTGYIASNFQFQFDSPPQANALVTEGFSVCANGTLALDGSAMWYQCPSGEINNLYNREWAEHCYPVFIMVSGGSTSPSASQLPDGQPQATPPVTQISDGQPQAPTGVTQISDGQPQAPMPTEVTQISDGQPQAPVPTAPVTQISDGQPQAPVPTSGAPVTQISDGQPQAPVPTTGAPVTQISDGQPQAPVPTGAPVTQISDGQPQAPVPTGAPVTQISDGQPQAPVPTASFTTPAMYTGAAAPMAVRDWYAIAAGAAAVVAAL